MKIVIYSRWPPETTGGVERFVASLRDALRNRGHACEVVCASELGCPDGSPYDQAARAFADHWARHGNAYDVAVFNKAEYAYKAEGGCTVLVVHGSSRGQIAAEWRIRPLHSTLASFFLYGHTQRRAGRRHFPVAVSRSTQWELSWLYGVRGSQVIENAIDVKQFAPGGAHAARKQLGLPLEARIYLYASRVEARKCPEFPALWAKALKSGEYLLVATDKPLSIEGRVTKLLNVQQEQMPRLYQAADAFLMPSYYEGCSYAVIEAMSSACLLVASPVGHAPDIVKADPLLAHCFEPRRNAGAFLERARRLLDDPPLAAKLKERERRYALENNSLEKMAGSYEALFEQLLRKKRNCRSGL